jgi:3-dehydroquinate synthase
VVSDEQVGPIYASRAVESLQKCGYQTHSFNIPVGEEHKNRETVHQLWDKSLEFKMDRGSTVVALGGGVVGDLAGFAAATYMRGIPWLVLPTSLLAMVDASLGGKTGFDLPQGKNLVGAFHPPRFVLVDSDALHTLPAVELRNGMAEVVKHGVIGDPALFDLCYRGLHALNEDWEGLIRRAMAVKARVIEEDPYESGVRASLNFGHTIGHAVEFVSGYRLRHGEAVAIGMVAETRMAEATGVCRIGTADRLVEVLTGLDLPTEIPPTLPRAEIFRALRVDKKSDRGIVRFALPVQIGEVKVGIEVNRLEKLIKGI